MLSAAAVKEKVSAAAAAGASVAAAGAARGTDAMTAATSLGATSVARAKQAYEDGKFTDMGESLAGVIQDRVDIAGLRDAGYGLAGEALATRKREAKIALMDMSAPMRQRALLGIREVLKAQCVADPDMWSCASRRITDGIDVFWDDLTVYIETIESDSKDHIRDKIISDVKALAELGNPPMCLSPGWWRALILYHFLPFDVSLFGCCKDPLFWIFTLASCCTSHGVRVAFFSLLLLLMLLGCPGDEYQLVQYILAFKGTQFISSGVCMAMVASVKYYMCVNPGGTHTCDTDGPGVNVGVASSLIDFFGCSILCWIVFLVLPTSTRSAGLREIATDPEAADNDKLCCCRWHPQRGGRIKGLLGYDLLCFLASCGLCYGLCYMTAKEMGHDEVKVSFLHTWEFQTAIFWARIFYSLLAFPFIVFMIPGINSILTHTSATGYNRNGICVPYMLHPMPLAAE